MAESQVTVKYYSSSSPPPNCAICLGAFSNKCFSDSCMHQFCFKCLLEWSKIKPECPLCKQPFTRIIHNFKSNEEYDEHVVEIRPPEEVHIIDNEEYLFLPIGQPPQSTRHHFHFRTTFTVDTHGEHAIQQMLLTHPQISVSTSGYPTTRNFSHRNRRRETATTTSFRRSIYIRNLWVIAPPDVTGRYRDVSPSFYSDCPGARTRLVPWLNRELNALLYENTQLVMRLVDIILDHLLRYHICSRTFRNLLYEYLDNKTDHFIHEFYNFMRSPFDMIGYDRQVIYTERPQTPYVITPHEEISDSGHDSDVILVSSTNPQEPVVIDLVNTDSDEPILISHEDPPPPPLIPVIHIPDNSPEPPSRERESRTPVLPLKLRLKHKRRSREEEREKRYRKRPRRHRSRSSSSSTSSDSSRNSSEKYKRKRKMKKLKRRLPSSESENNFSTDSDSDVPLSVLMNKRRFKKSSASSKKSSKSITKESEDRDSSSENRDLPSCSKYSEAVDLRTNLRRESPDDLDTPTCSRYERPNRTCTVSIKTRLDDSSDDEYMMKPQVKSEIKPIKKEPNVTTSKNSERIRNIKIKKENWSNSWYSYQCDYDSSDNEDLSNSKSVI